VCVFGVPSLRLARSRRSAAAHELADGALPRDNGDVEDQLLVADTVVVVLQEVGVQLGELRLLGRELAVVPDAVAHLVEAAVEAQFLRGGEVVVGVGECGGENGGVGGHINCNQLANGCTVGRHNGGGGARSRRCGGAD